LEDDATAIRLASVNESDMYRDIGFSGHQT
jgi:hypothetical protein